MRNRYTIDFSAEDLDLARNVITGFCKELSVQAARPMTRPTIAISSTKIEWGQFGFDTSDKVAIVLNINVLSKGRLKSLTAGELLLLLFDDGAAKKVAQAMINMMAWLQDIQRRGFNAINEREVLGFVTEISNTFVESLEKYLACDRPY